MEPTHITRTLYQLTAAYKTLLRLSGLMLQDGALAIYRARKLLEPHWDFYNEEQQKRISACGGTVDETGVIHFADDPPDGSPEISESRRKYQDMYIDLLNTDIELDVIPATIKMDAISAAGGAVCVNEMILLDGIVNFE